MCGFDFYIYHMSTVLPLLSDGENKQKICEWLEAETGYDIVSAADDEIGDLQFDLCLVDISTVKRHRSALEEKAARADAAFLPSLLFASRQSVQNLDFDVWEYVDDVLWHAVEESVISNAKLNTEFRGRLRSLFRRRKTELEQQESKAKYRSLTEDVLKSSDVGTIIVGPDETVVWFNEVISTYFGVSRDSYRGTSYGKLAAEVIEPALSEPEQLEERTPPVTSSEKPGTSFVCRIDASDRSERRWVHYWNHQITSGVYEGGRIEHFFDVTTQREHEQSLQNLHQSSRELMQAETPSEIYAAAVRAADDILGLSSFALFLWDETAGVLRVESSTTDTDEYFDELPVFEPEDSLAWDAFVDGETRLFDDVRDHENVYNPDTVMRSELMVPLGDYGVFVTGATTTGAFSENDVQAVETLAANTTTALERANRERDLAENEARLADQKESITRLNRVNTIIRNIQRDVVAASTRETVEAAVCDNLVQAEPYKFAWIGSIGWESEQVTPLAWAGDENGYLDEVLPKYNQHEQPDQFPALQAWETGQPVVIHDIRSKLDTYPWAKAALEQGNQSVLAIPLVFRDTVYEVVEVFSGHPTAFTTDEREMLLEVCNFVANALNAIERKQALLTESNVELEFHVGPLDDILFQLARNSDCEFDLNSVFLQPHGGWVLYITVTEGDPDAIESVCEQSVSVERITPVTTREDTFELEVSAFQVGILLAEKGATLHSLTATPEGGRLVVHLPQTTDVRSFVDSCTEALSEAELVRQNRITSDIATTETQQQAVNQLTDRQREVLEIAHQNGFFAWPRENTGEEIAARLDVSPPTFHRHVRRGTDKLLESLFEQ